MILHRELTIVIPAYNEEDYIGNLLSDIAAQDHIHNVKVYVADGGSTDKTVDICLKMANVYKHIDIEVIKGGSVTRGRNAGLSKVDTKYVIFIDADVRLSNSCHIFHTWYLLNNKTLVATRLSSSAKGLSKLAYQLFNLYNKHILHKRKFAMGSFFATRTLVIKSLGGWDETLIHGEDWVLSGKYRACDTELSKYPAIVDDRRFKKSGYFWMLKLMIMSAIHGEDYMRKDHGYWK